MQTGEEEEARSRRRLSAAALLDRYHRRDDPRIFGHFLPSHLLYCLSIFSLTLSFSHDFNGDVALRKRLYQAGFIIDQVGRLPQLFELEARVTHFVWSAMFRTWKEGGSREALTGEAAAGADAEAVLEGMEDLPTGREADVLTSPRVVAMIAAPPSASYRAAYDAVVLLSYHRASLLTTRLLTDYLTKTQAGQMVALEHVDDVVADMVEQYAGLELRLFECDLEVMLPLLGELCEWGSQNVRAAVRRWIQGKGMRMARMALRGDAGEEEEEEEEEGEEEDGEAVQPVSQPHGGGKAAAAFLPRAVSSVAAGSPPAHPLVGEGELIERSAAPPTTAAPVS